MSKKKGITQEDAENILNYCAAFGIDLPKEDLVTLNRIKKEPKNKQLNEEDIKELKRLMCLMLTTNTHESFQHEIWSTSKESAQDMLDEMDTLENSSHTVVAKEALKGKDE